jgi:putative ABC transport system permease protein
MISDLLRDLRVALRGLVREPVFSVTAILILALGMGATTGMFSLMNTLLLRNLPYPESEGLVRLYRTAGRDSVALPHSSPTFRDYRDQNSVFNGLAAFFHTNASLADEERPPEPVAAMGVTADFFSILQVKPLRGRLFLAEENRFDHHRVVIVSAEFWQTRLGGDPNVIGRQVRIDGMSVTVVGVMPPGFNHTALWGQVDLWRPAGYFPTNDRNTHWLQILGRLKPGVSLSAAQAHMNMIAAGLDRTYGTKSGVRVAPLQESGENETGKRIGWLSMSLASFVLLIVCINLAGVQLVRLTGRGHEHAVRCALGASRWRLMRQFMAESLLLSALGGGIGLLVASWAIDLIGNRMLVGSAQVPVDIRLDGHVLAFGAVLGVFTTLAVGIVPAWLTSRTTVSSMLRSGGRGTTAKSHAGLRQALVVAEMALALILLTAGGLFLRGLQHFVARDPGWRVDGLMTARITLPSSRYAKGAPMDVFRDRSRRFFDRLQQELPTLPGVTDSAISVALPLWSFRTIEMELQGRPVAPGQEPIRYVNGVSADYFKTLGIGLVEGRVFTPSDGGDGAPVIIINQAMAHHFWPGQSALGKQIGGWPAPRSSPSYWRTVVGVVADVRFAADLAAPVSRFQTYVPWRDVVGPVAMLALRTSGGGLESVAGELRRRVASLDSELPIHELLTARRVVDNALANFLVTGWVLLGFAVLGLCLAALGTYGLFSGFVAQRRQEIGLRIALGAQRYQVLWFVLGKGLRIALLGAGLGVAAALLVVRLLRSTVGELATQEPFAVAALASVLVLVALFACWLPARRAAALDPIKTLRDQ